MKISNRVKIKAAKPQLVVLLIGVKCFVWGVLGVRGGLEGPPEGRENQIFKDFKNHVFDRTAFEIRREREVENREI
jgi:hypothetical protein